MFARAIAGCAPDSPAVDATKCAGAESFYDHAATEVIDAGLCDDYRSPKKIEDCPPYRAIEEAYVATMQELKCPSSQR